MELNAIAPDLTLRRPARTTRRTHFPLNRVGGNREVTTPVPWAPPKPIASSWFSRLLSLQLFVLIYPSGSSLLRCSHSLSFLDVSFGSLLYERSHSSHPIADPSLCILGCLVGKMPPFDGRLGLRTLALVSLACLVLWLLLADIDVVSSPSVPALFAEAALEKKDVVPGASDKDLDQTDDTNKLGIPILGGSKPRPASVPVPVVPPTMTPAVPVPPAPPSSAGSTSGGGLGGLLGSILGGGAAGGTTGGILGGITGGGVAPTGDGGDGPPETPVGLDKGNLLGGLIGGVLGGAGAGPLPGTAESGLTPNDQSGLLGGFGKVLGTVNNIVDGVMEGVTSDAGLDPSSVQGGVLDVGGIMDSLNGALSLPSPNVGKILDNVVGEVLEALAPVGQVVDGITDAVDQATGELLTTDGGLRGSLDAASQIIDGLGTKVSDILDTAGNIEGITPVNNVLDDAAALLGGVQNAVDRVVCLAGQILGKCELQAAQALPSDSASTQPSDQTPSAVTTVPVPITFTTRLGSTFVSTGVTTLSAKIVSTSPSSIPPQSLSSMSSSLVDLKSMVSSFVSQPKTLTLTPPSPTVAGSATAAGTPSVITIPATRSSPTVATPSAASSPRPAVPVVTSPAPPPAPPTGQSLSAIVSTTPAVPPPGPPAPPPGPPAPAATAAPPVQSMAGSSAAVPSSSPAPPAGPPAAPASPSPPNAPPKTTTPIQPVAGNTGSAPTITVTQVVTSITSACLADLYVRLDTQFMVRLLTSRRPPGSPAAACECPVTPAPNGASAGPDKEYPCECCPGGTFYPPPQTPARAAPCGYGWACADCPGMWFCPGNGGPTAGGGQTGRPSPHTPMAVVITVTAPPQTVIVTSVATAATSPSTPFPSVLQPPDHQGDWKYAGCFEDNTKRALKGDNNLLPGDKGMSNAACIAFCQSKGFTVSGTTFGSQCYCGMALVDSYRTEAARCNTTCTADSFDVCGGPMALTVYSPDGNPPVEAGPILGFTIPEPAPGVTELSVHIGGIRQTVLPVTTPYFVYPAPMSMRPVASAASSSCSTSPQAPATGNPPANATPPPSASNPSGPSPATANPGSGAQNSPPPPPPPANTGSAAPVANSSPPPPPPPLTVPPNAGQGSGGRYGNPFAQRAARGVGVRAEHDRAGPVRRQVMTIW